MAYYDDLMLEIENTKKEIKEKKEYLENLYEIKEMLEERGLGN